MTQLEAMALKENDIIIHSNRVALVIENKAGIIIKWQNGSLQSGSYSRMWMFDKIGCGIS